MAIREIREKGDEILYKKCKAVVKFDEKLHILLDDMYETMQSRDGVGLAAPQVGILKRAVVIDVGDGKIELINPEIVCLLYTSKKTIKILPKRFCGGIITSKQCFIRK